MIELIGRFHLLLLHLPIGIFVLVFLLEIDAQIRKNSSHREAITSGLFIGTCAAILSCGTGLILANGGDYNGDLINEHKWFAIGMTVLSIIVFILNIRKERKGSSGLYFGAFIALILLLGITGHKGGTLTHGEGFLNKSVVVHREPIEDINEAVAFEQIIAPILKSKCISCHRSSKSKGDLILTDSLSFEKGGKSGPVVKRANLEESELLQRIHLPMQEEEHMPPKSKKQLTQDEITLLEWWISEGASFSKRIANLEKSDEIDGILKKYIQPKSLFDRLKIPSAKESTISSLIAAGIPAKIIANDGPFIEVSLAHAQDLSKTKLNKLAKVGQQLIKLNLSFSNIDDDMLSVLSELPHLQNLQLQGTNITERSIKHIKELKYLKILNLYDTKVNNEAVKFIKGLPSLNSIYLWQTSITQDSIDGLRQAKPLLGINYNEGAEIFGDANLRPPMIIAKQDLFRDSLQVELKLNFKNVNFYYTLDGSNPDSTSFKYEGPIVINKTSLIKAMTKKSGWNDSDISERQFVQSKYEVHDVVLEKKPSDKYSGSGAKTLVDFVKGSNQFTDGNWLGYEGEHLIAVLDLGSPQLIESVSVSALDASGSWIFFPRGMQIETSIDGRMFNKQAAVKFPQPRAMEPPSIKNFTEDIESTNARYVKVTVESILKNPDWHANPGGKSWLFVDEIVVN